MEMLKLPGGYLDEKGIVHREVEMNPLTGKEEELVAQNHKQESASLVTMVLSRCLRRLGSIAPVPVNVIGRLPVEDRQFLLLKLREITFGDRVQATVTCPGPGCGNKVDINFSTKDITDREHVDKEPQIELELEANCPGCGREFTIPFDIPDFFFRELRTTIDLLYREVHFLAYHYHWSEGEILEMSREKRHKYIEILLEEIENMTDERSFPPGGFRSLSPCLHPLKEDNKMEVKGMQGPTDDGHDKNPHWMKTRQKDPMKNETPQEGDARDTEMEENPAQETRKRENIEIPGFSEKSIAFPSLDRENPQSQKSELGGVPPSVGVNLVFTQKKDKIEFPDSLPVEDKVTEIETQLPTKMEKSTQQASIHITGSRKLQEPAAVKKGVNEKSKKSEAIKEKSTETQLPEEIGKIVDGKTVELEKFESPRQEHPIKNSNDPVNKFQIPNSKFQTNSKSQIPNFKQKPNSGSQTKSKSQMLNKSQTLDPENRQSQKPELGGIPSSLGVNLVFTQEKDKIEFPDSLPVEDKVTEIETQLPAKMEKSTQQASIHITGSKKLQESAAVKKGVNEKSKKSEAIKEKSIETQLPEEIGKPGEPDRMEKSTGYDVRTGESKVKVISTDEIVSRSSPEAVLRIEQLREQVRRLNEKNSSSTSHLSHLSSSSTLSPPDLSLSSTGMEDPAAREIKTGEQPSTANPPNQPVTMVKSLPTRTNTSQTTSAFWERSYLARFHLKTLR